MRVLLLGSTGIVGAAVAQALRQRGQDCHPLDPRSGPAAAGDAVDAAVGEVAVVITATGGDLPVTRAVIERAVAAGIDVVDVDREVGHLTWLHRTAAVGAAASGARLVGAAGVRFAVGDLLAALAAELVEVPTSLHVAYTGGGGVTVGTPGERRAAAAALGRTGTARLDHRAVEEYPGEARRLAWFPRPVGPSHAAAVPGGEVVTVPLHLPQLATIRTYESLTGWRAELLQARANLARTGWGRRLLLRRLARAPRRQGPALRAGQRWGCVAEVAGVEQLGRAWAYGHDPVRVSAELTAELVVGLLDSSATVGRGGARAPSQVLDPVRALDAVADRTDLRWSRSSVALPAR